MARYPFLEKANEFMKTRLGCIAETTWKAQMSRYNRMFRELVDLNSKGSVSTVSPSKLTPEDVKAFLVFRKAQRISGSNYSHDISALDQLCLYCGNTAVKECLRANESLKPVKNEDRLPPLSEGAIEKIFEYYANEADHSDFFEVRAYAIVIMSITLGTRNKELRLSNIRDLDTASWLIKILHPKGEGSYGKVRTVPVPPVARPVILDYLSLRQDWLDEKGVKTNALFFSVRGDHEHLSGNSFRKIKQKVEADIGVGFELRDCRRAFGQGYVDKGMDIAAVSLLLGHRNTKTTENYYCRLSETDAIEEARARW